MCSLEWDRPVLFYISQCTDLKLLIHLKQAWPWMGTVIQGYNTDIAYGCNDKKYPLKKFLDAVGDPDHHQNLIICTLCRCFHFLNISSKSQSTTSRALLQTTNKPCHLQIPPCKMTKKRCRIVRGFSWSSTAILRHSHSSIGWSSSLVTVNISAWSTECGISTIFMWSYKIWNTADNSKILVEGTMKS